MTINTDNQESRDMGKEGEIDADHQAETEAAALQPEEEEFENPEDKWKRVWVFNRKAD